MKRARFLVDGRVEEGVLSEPGVLVDSTGASHAEDAVVFLPPVVPGKIVGLALNYADHAAELEFAEPPKEPALFFKADNTLTGHGSPVVYPDGVDYMHYEVELAAVIGRTCRHARADDAYDLILGYTIANDVTIRDFVGNFYRPPVRAKGWDTFLPLGPYLVEGEIDDPGSVGLRTYVNGELRQEGNTSDLVWTIPELVEFITSFMTLNPGDVILTGTPRGISHVFPGDVMRLEVDGLGALENPVVAETPGAEARAA